MLFVVNLKPIVEEIYVFFFFFFKLREFNFVSTYLFPGLVDRRHVTMNC